MKQLLIIGTLLLAMAGKVSAQNCEAIVLPHFGNNQAALQMINDQKLATYCYYARHAFFVTNTLPEGAISYSITAVKDVFTGAHLPSTFEVDLETLSYYAYNFNDFRINHWGRTVYFSTPNSTYRYLVLRPESGTRDFTPEEAAAYLNGTFDPDNER